MFCRFHLRAQLRSPAASALQSVSAKPVLHRRGCNHGYSYRGFVIAAAAAGVLLLAHCDQVSATPYLPQHDDAVLERLPAGAFAATAEIRDLRATLRERPQDLAVATQLAWRYFELGRRDADPRYFGYAEGVLQPWWNTSQPPSVVLLLRATLRQKRHEFDLALTDLSVLVARDPLNAQAWLTRAVVLQVRGDYALARASCGSLWRLDVVLATACIGNVNSLTGQAATSTAQLRHAVERGHTAPVTVQLYLLTSLAEIAARLGNAGDAQQWYRQALALGERAIYLVTSYADFLLDQNRPAEVETLLASETRVDSLLLRLALAERTTGARLLQEHVEVLRARFAASRLRGDRTHQGEESRFVLYLLKDPARALTLAQANWAVQREPRDARILLEAALAARNPAAAQPVREILLHTGLEDQQLAAIVARLDAPP